MPKKELTLLGFLDNSALLVQASPTTTRLTLKYKLPKPTEANATPTAVLVAKAYDPVGGVCLKYETNRGFEVGRLMRGFQELGQHMQNIPPTLKRKSSGEEVIKGEPMQVDEPPKSVQEVLKQGAQAGNQPGGGKKKKKGKR